MFNIAITERHYSRKLVDFLSDRYNVIYTNKTGMGLNDEQLIEAITDVHGVIAGTERYSEKVFLSSPKLKVISRIGAGFDNIDMEFARQANVKVTGVFKSHVDAVAEHAITLLFSVMKNIPRYDSEIRRGINKKHHSSLLNGKKVLIIGFGRVGKNIADSLDTFVLPNISYVDPVCNEDCFTRSKTSLIPGVIHNDIIILCASRNYRDPPIMTMEVFEHCHGNIFINIARGPLVDEDALLWAIRHGNISAAGLDVTMSEPYRGPLLDYPNVLITPHVATYIPEVRDNMEMEAAGNLIKELGI
jgi:D-3-phosphoglycerate dehydrogenase